MTKYSGEATNAYLKATYVWTDFFQCRDRVKCADGFTISIQVGKGIYSSPHTPNSTYYSEVELGFPSEHDELLDEYAEEPDDPTGTVYPYTPVGVVDELLAKHGGIESSSFEVTWVNCGHCGTRCDNSNPSCLKCGANPEK